MEGGAPGAPGAAGVARPAGRGGVSGRLVAALVGVVAVAAIAAVVVFLMFGGGGEEEGDNVVLAVAFRLDGGSPVLSGYIGDPGEDAFELAAGRYYIEAVDQDDVIVSLGAVDMEEGEAVEFPESFEAVGGVADAERVEPLLTMAEFLVDVELAKLMFLEIVTGGFTEIPFDPAVEIDPASVGELFDMYAGIGEEKEAVLEALSGIEGRAEVSLETTYVRSAGAPGPGAFDKVREEAEDFFDLTLGVRDHQRQRVIGFVESIPKGYHHGVLPLMPSDLKVVGDEEASDIDEWLDFVRQGELDNRLSGIEAYLQDYARAEGVVIAARKGKEMEYLAECAERGEAFAAAVFEHIRSRPPNAEGLLERHEAWVRHARGLAERLAGGDPAQAREQLLGSIRRGVEGLLPDAAADFKDRLAVQIFARLVAEFPPELAGTPRAVSAGTPTLTRIPGATETSEPDTSWIEGFVQSVSDRMVDEGYSGELTARVVIELRECLTQAVLGGKSKEEAVQYCSEAIGEEPRDVSAVGQFVLDVSEGCVLEKNTISLTYNTGGGPGSVRGEGGWQEACVDLEECPPRVEWHKGDFEGEYDPDSGKLSGTVRAERGGVMYVDDAGTEEIECERATITDEPDEGIPWQATVQDGVVRGAIDLTEVMGQAGAYLEFELRVEE